jgi:hypothetical protein
MFIDKTHLKEKIAVKLSGPEVQPEEIFQSLDVPMIHATGCEGHMAVYYDVQSSQIRAKCGKCGSAYTLARTEDGFFKRG